MTPFSVLTSDLSIILRLTSFLSDDSASICSLTALNRSCWDLLGDHSAGQINHEHVWKVLFEQRWPSMSWILTASGDEVLSDSRGWKQMYVDRSMCDHTLQKGKPRQIVLESHTCAVSAMCQIDIRSNNLGFVDTKRPTIITADEEGGMIQWDPTTGLQMKFMDVIHQTKVISIQPVPQIPNRVVSCESGRAESNGDGAQVVLWDAFLGNDKIYEVIENINCVGGVAGESVGPVGAFLWLSNQCFVCAAGADLFVWYNNAVEDSNNFFLLHHIPNAHTYDITTMKKVHGFTGGLSDPTNDGDNGLVIVTGSMDGSLKTWNVDSGSLLFSLDGHNGSITQVDTSATGYIVSASSDSTAKVWDKSGDCISTLVGHTKGLTCVMVDKNPKRTVRIVTGSSDRTVRVWDRQRNNEFTCTHVLSDHSARISTVHFNEALIITGSSDRNIYVYDAQQADPEKLGSLKLVTSSSHHLGNISSILFDDFGRFYFAGSADGSITIYNCMPTRKHTVQSSTNKNQKDVWVSPLYDTTSNTYMGPPTPTWSSLVTDKLPDDYNAIEVVPILTNRFKDVLLLYNVLSPSECSNLIKETETLQYEDCHGYHVQYRSNKRVIIMDHKTCDVVSDRIRAHVPQTVIRQGYEWNLEGLNEVWRFCRYTPGQHFSPHIDGYFARNEDNRSWFTFMIYLNGGFTEGTTRFLKDRQSLEVLEKVVPQAGMTLVFPHELLHDGEPLGSESKYIMRSDVMYKRGKRVN